MTWPRFSPRTAAPADRRGSPAGTAESGPDRPLILVPILWLAPMLWLLPGSGLGLGITRLEASDQAPRVGYSEDVRPILASHCWSCHGPDDAGREAGVRLDRREEAVKTLENGAAAVVPGNPTESALIRRILSDDPDTRMPPPSSGKLLSEHQKQILTDWIAQGAEFETHWALRSPVLPELPQVRLSDWPRNPIDQFVLARLEGVPMPPSPEAPPSVWLRRVTLDLTGLPPSPKELDDFLASLEQESADVAFERVVDRLLTSFAHAERMAMHWLDLARYADTNGYNNDEVRTMWPWRDWVIQAFADNMPYDQFITEQLAGDLLPEPTLRQKVATGFSRNHVLTTEGGIIEAEYRAEYVADRVHTAATVFLALSMQCARCHDHKYDPVTQPEYYQFASFFDDVPDRIVPHSQGQMADPLLKVPSPEQQEELNQAEQQILSLRNSLKALPADRAGDLPSRLEALEKRRQQLEAEIPTMMVMSETSERRPTFVLIRGAYDQPGAQVAAAFPAALTFSGTTTPEESGGDRTVAAAERSRLDLARWLTDPSHPLTARVAVNRCWELLFGTGLVETSEDFGVQGSPPTHPELLDWLALEFVRNGWNQRALLKQIVLSATYRQSSQIRPDLLERDPRNRLLGRSARFRLAGETVRDNALFVSGLLHQAIGGPSVRPYQPEGLWEDVSVSRRDKYVPDSGAGLYRRSMYTFWKRTCPPPTLSTFDAPDRETCVIRRARTNTPLQALVLLNDPTYLEASRRLAELVWAAVPSEGPEADRDRLNEAYRRVLTRLPAEDEAEIFLALTQSAVNRFQQDAAAAQRLITIGASGRSLSIPDAQLAGWTAAMSILLNLDETISRP